ncbi:MAG: hypothetical protein KGJ02_05305 [Verrucomicrobiota bacterium]|nr:hypothetical protein [Verrucomicrobiota bacterium]
MVELETLSPEEKECLEDLFEYFSVFDSFHFTLFGSKPVSIAHLIPTDKIQEGWKAWEKIAPLFHSENFVIRKYTFRGKDDWVLVANLVEVEKVYKANQTIFDQVCGRHITAEEFKRCLKEESPLFQTLIESHLATGILLGYGTRNAQLFAENQQLPKEKKYPLSHFSSLPPIVYWFSCAPPPYFACDPNSDETEELRKRYKRERAAIVQLTKKEPLYITMLKRLKNESVVSFAQNER